MTITLTPEIEAALTKEAQARGTSPEHLLLEKLRAEFASIGTEQEQKLEPIDYRITLPPPVNEWQIRLRYIGIPCGVSLTDEQISRDSLYEEHL